MQNLLNKDLGEFTVGWFLLSVIVGGIFGAAIKYLFEVRLPQSMKRKQRIEEKVRKYSYPLLQAASDIELRIQNILNEGVKEGWLKSSVIDDLNRGEGFLKDPCKGIGYFFLSTVYVFARYFAWIEILKREAGFLDFPRGEESMDFYDILHRVNNAFRSTDLWELNNGKQEARDCTLLHRHTQSAIGEIMITERNKILDCISFREFVDKYTDHNNDRFRFWLRNLMSYFEDLSDIDIADMAQVLSEKGEFRILRLIAIQYWYFKLIQFLDPYFEKVQYRDELYEKKILEPIAEPYRTAVINLQAD
jgi:hypothetical protein